MSATLRVAAPRLATVAMAAVLTGVGLSQAAALPSLARLTASGTTSSATVTSGTVALSLTNGAASGSWLGTTSVAPGGAAYAAITVTNSGKLPLTYTVSSVSNSALASSLTITVAKLASTSTSCTSSGFANGTASSAGTVDLGSSGGTTVVSSRPLAVNASEKLCAKIQFPSASGLGYAARGTTATTVFTFAAVQA